MGLDEMVGNTLFFRNRSHQMVHHEEVMKVLPDPDGLSLVDVGCGWGDFSAQLPETTRYIGIDVRPEVIEVAKGAYPGREFRCGRRIPPADLIVAIAVLADSVVDPQLMIRRMWARAGRAMVVTVYAAWVHKDLGEDVFRSWFPKEPDVFDRRDDFFRVALYK